MREITYTKAGIIILAYSATLIGVSYWAFHSPTPETPKTNLTTPALFNSTDKIKSILTSMYEANGVEDLVRRNDDLKKSFSNKLLPLIDLTDQKIYLQRYFDFKNKPIRISFKEIAFDASANTVTAFYSVSNQVDMPSSRVAIFKVENGIITEFKEYRISKEITEIIKSEDDEVGQQ